LDSFQKWLTRSSESKAQAKELPAMARVFVEQGRNGD
jgi:hypothetical protein